MSADTMPRLTILMPMKNAEAYVADAARSVLDQQGVDMELIVIDDGSTDRSRAVVAGIDDARIRIIDGPGRGISAAFNTGLAQARGEFIARCDADDRYTKGRLAAQLRTLEERPECAAICSAFAAMDPRGRHMADLGDRVQEEDITDELRRGETRTHLNTFLMRTEAVRRLGGCRDYFASAEDLDLQFRLAGEGRVFWTPQVVYHYRLHDSSTVHTQAAQLREHFEQCARDFARQRAAGEPDDLERGAPPAPPEGAHGQKPSSGREHRQSILLGAAWREHARGRRGEALRAGFRACLTRPESIDTWRSFTALIFKSPAGRA